MTECLYKQPAIIRSFSKLPPVAISETAECGQKLQKRNTSIPQKRGPFFVSFVGVVIANLSKPDNRMGFGRPKGVL